MKFDNLTFDRLEADPVASQQWAGIAKTAFDKEAFKFLANLTGKSLREAQHAQQLASAGRVAREAELATAAARAGKPAEELLKAKTKLKGMETTYKAKGWGQRALERVKAPFGKGEHAAISKQKAKVVNIRAKRDTGVVGGAKANLTAAQQAEVQAAEAARLAGEDVRSARTLAGVGLVGTGVAAMASGGGSKRRGPVIVA